MSYKQQAGSTSKQGPIAKKPSKQKLATTLLAVLPMFTVIGATAALSGCGFQLRGYDAPMLLDVAKTAVIIEDNRTSFPLKLPLTKNLETLGVDVVSNITADEVARNNKQAGAQPMAIINIEDLSFKSYELVGVLTEIRLVISANVNYQTMENGQPITLSNPIQIERSYQYNDASVSTDDQQGNQITEWLYDSLARRITDQYAALSLPKVPSAGATIPVQPGNGSSSTAVVTPNP